jgi:hypothetical protein
VGGLWLSYADNIKDGNMHASFIVGLAERLSGTTLAATSLQLSGGDPSKGIPVSPKVGSYIETPWAKAAAGGATAFEWVLGCKERATSPDPVGDFLNFQYCNMHFILNIWYQTVSRLLGIVGDWGASAVIALWHLGTLDDVLEALLVAKFGPNWQEELGRFAAAAILDLFGLLVDAGARGAELYNNIYTGIDVLINRYLLTNFGATQKTPDVAAFTLGLAKEHYRESVAVLPAHERLFSMDVPTSLTNKFLIAAPTSPDPGTMIATILKPIKALPSTFMSLISGRSLAAPDILQIAAVNGVAQMSYSEAELDADIAPEVMEQADPQCPPNEPGKYNNCQRYKELLNSVRCVNLECPAMPQN